MSRTTRHTRRILLALVLAALAATALPAIAGAVLVTVRVEGAERTLLSPTQVEIGAREASARSWNGTENERLRTCAADTAYQAIELAVRGNWDRELFITRLVGESHTFSPNEEYWIPYYNNNYADWGICDLHLVRDDVILMQAGRSGLEELFIPDSVPLRLERVSPESGAINVRGRLTVHVTKWRPTDIFGTQDPENEEHFIIPPSEPTDAVGYTVSGGGTSATTDGSGNATLTLNRAGRSTVQANMPGSTLNWSRSIPVAICVEDRTRIC